MAYAYLGRDQVRGYKEIRCYIGLNHIRFYVS